MLTQKTHNFCYLAAQEKSITGSAIVVALATLMTSLAISSINILLPSLVGHFDATFSQVQWVIIAYMLFLTSTLVLAGRLSDTFGGKRLFLIGLVVFTISAAVCGLAKNIWLLIGIRAIQGIGSAILITVTMALVSDIFHKNKVASAMGLIASMSAIGTGLGPVLGGLIVDGLNWQLVFFMNIPIGIIIFLLANKYLPNDKRIDSTAKVSINLISIFLLFSTIISFTLTIKFIGNAFDTTNILLWLLSLLFLIAYITVERSSKSPLIALSILKDSELITGLLSNFIVSIVVMSSLVIGPFYLVVALGLNATQTGIAMAASPITVAITASLVGRIVNIGGLKKIILIGMLIIMLAAIGMTFIKVTYGLTGYLLCLVTMAIGYATFLSSNNALAMSDISPTTRGSLSGILNLSRNFGLLTGASLMSAVFASVSQLTDINTASSQLIEAGLHAVYQLASLFLAVAITTQLIAICRTRKNAKH